MGRLDDLRDNRQRNFADAAGHLPAPRGGENDSRGLKAGAAIATGNPCSESGGVRVQSSAGDFEVARDPSRPRELDLDRAVRPGAAVVGRADDASRVQLDPEPPIAVAEPAGQALAGRVVPVRQGDRAGRRLSWMRGPIHVGSDRRRPARGRVGSRVSDRPSRTRGEKQRDNHNDSAHASSTPRHGRGFRLSRHVRRQIRAPTAA